MNKKLIDLTEQELRSEIDTLAGACDSLEFEYRGETPEERCEENVSLLNLKRRLVAAVYFAKQKNFKKALEPIDHFGGECAGVMAKWYLEDIMFVDASLRRYNTLMKQKNPREAYKIVDRLKDMGLMC